MSLAGPRFSSESAPRPFHHGIRRTKRNNLSRVLAVERTEGTRASSNSLRPSSREGHSTAKSRPCCRTNSRHKGFIELSSSIVPRGTFHRSVELKFSPIAFNPARLSCCYCFSGPPELGAINPYAVHDHGQPTCQGHDRLFHPTVPCDLHRPGLEPGPFGRTLEHGLGRLEPHRAHHGIPAFRAGTHSVDLT